MEKGVNTDKIAIVHDSGSSLHSEYINYNFPNLVEVPFTVTAINGNQSKEWIDNPFKSDKEKSEFIHDLQTAELSTSQPSPDAYTKAFENIIDRGITEIAVVPMSRGLSGSINSAELAALGLRNEANIVVADCKTITIGQGLLVTQAYMENENGEFNNANEMATRIEQLSKQLYVAQAFPSLEHLRKGGRIGLASSMVGGILGIVPIIGANDEGKLVPIDKKRGMKRTREAIIDYVSANVGQQAVRLALIEFESNQIDYLIDDIDDRFVIATDKNGKEYDIMRCRENMVTAAHSGLGVFGLGALIIKH
jgi:DegV family protein with EDD domain